MSLTTLTIRETSVIATDGDSRSAIATAGDRQNLSRVWVPLRARCDAAFRSRVPTIPRKVVPWLNWAVDGATTTTALTALPAQLALQVPTHIILYIGINDVRTAVLLATILANVSAYMTAAFAAGVQEIMVVGPDFSGELWSVGDAGNPNAFDAAIKAAIAPAALPATVNGFADGLWFNNREEFFNVYEPVYNAPVPGVVGGILTQDALVGLHQNSRGTALQAALWDDVFTFVT